MGAMNIAGRRIVATATPTLNWSPVSWRTYHSAATSKMKSPDCDTSCPAQRSENGRLERTRRKLGLPEIVWVRGEHDWACHSLLVSLKSVPIGGLSQLIDDERGTRVNCPAHRTLVPFQTPRLRLRPSVPAQLHPSLATPFRTIRRHGLTSQKWDTVENGRSSRRKEPGDIKRYSMPPFSN